MITVTFIAADGGEQVITASQDLSLMENAIANGVEAIVATCGGNAYCGTCRVYIEPAWRAAIDPMADIEQAMIDETGEEQQGARLSCQIMLTPALSGVVVRTPARQE